MEIHSESADGPLIGRFCGNQIPTNLTAANKLWVKFNSDREGTGNGFIAQYNLRELLKWLIKVLKIMKT